MEQTVLPLLKRKVIRARLGPAPVGLDVVAQDRPAGAHVLPGAQHVQVVRHVPAVRVVQGRADPVAQGPVAGIVDRAGRGATTAASATRQIVATAADSRAGALAVWHAWVRHLSAPHAKPRFLPI